MTDLSQLFAESGLDDEAVEALDLTVDKLGPAINAGLGTVDIDELDVTEVTLVRLLVDDTGSIQYGGNVQTVIDGHNLVLDSLAQAKSAGAVLVSCQYITGGQVLYPFVPLAQAVRMNTSNYRADGNNTPLYDMTGATLASVVAKMSEFEAAGVTVRGVTYVITDGADNNSRTHDSRSVKSIVEGLLRRESHIVGAVGIDDGGFTDFKAVFAGMGIPDQWILTPGNSPQEIRRAFNLISQSAVRASQAAGTFSQTALGGFGTGNAS